MNRYHGCHNFENLIINAQNYVSGRNKDMKNELKYLTQKECEMKLRTEHINLNHYLYTMGIVRADIVVGEYVIEIPNRPNT